MLRKIIKPALIVGLLATFAAFPVMAGSVNKSVKVEAGTESSGESSVNGSITVAADAVVSGDVSTVNGSIRVGAGAKIEDASTVNGTVKISENVEVDNLDTVNGSIRVGESATVAGGIEAVNGKISLEKGASVADDVGNVNGAIELAGAEVSGDISTVAGDVSIVEGAVVKGNVIVQKPSNWSWGKKKQKKPRIVIGPGATVAGNIELEREVDLFISDTASVGGVTGVMTMDDAVRFSGERP